MCLPDIKSSRALRMVELAEDIMEISWRYHGKIWCYSRLQLGLGSKTPVRAFGWKNARNMMNRAGRRPLDDHVLGPTWDGNSMVICCIAIEHGIVK